MFKRILDEYFAFNQQQRKGLFVLVCICFILFVIRLVYPIFMKPGIIEIKQLPLLPMEVANGSQIDDVPTSPAQTFLDSVPASAGVRETLFVFNPNTIGENELRQLGLNKKTTSTYLQFRERGFVFKRKTDLQKVYGIGDVLYQKLEPFIDLQNPAANKTASGNRTKIVLNQKLPDLNEADSVILDDTHLFDAGSAARLLKYRNKLGGFVNINQLTEVFGFDKKTTEKVAKCFVINPKNIRKISVKRANLSDLKKHPYIGDDLAKKIIAQRAFKSLQWPDIVELAEDQRLIKRLKPYLLFD